MISAFGVDHGEISKGAHWDGLVARQTVRGVHSMKGAFVKLNLTHNPNMKMRVGQLRRSDPRFDDGKAFRAAKKMRSKKAETAFVPTSPREMLR